MLGKLCQYLDVVRAGVTLGRLSATKLSLRQAHLQPCARTKIRDLRHLRLAVKEHRVHLC